MKQLSEVTDAVELLSRTPALIDQWLIGLPAAWLEADEGEGTFDPVEVVAHLVYGEETDWLPRMELLIQHGEAVPFPPFDREGFRTRFEGWSLERLVPRFSSARRENIDKLRDLRLSPVDLNRTGMHPTLGRVTLRQLLAAWVVHDLTHLSQIARVLAKRYTDTVGPWREYLGVLNDRRG